jgi:hypothetical protein
LANSNNHSKAVTNSFPFAKSINHSTANAIHQSDFDRLASFLRILHQFQKIPGNSLGEVRPIVLLNAKCPILQSCAVN